MTQTKSLELLALCSVVRFGFKRKRFRHRRAGLPSEGASGEDEHSPGYPMGDFRNGLFPFYLLIFTVWLR